MSKESKENETKVCSFCKQKETKENVIIVADDVSICKSCVAVASDVLGTKDMDIFSDTPEESTDLIDWDVFSPVEVKNTLDEAVIGQNQAKKVLAVAVYNHYKRLLKLKTGEYVQKSNILMIGPTGSGKTLLAQTIAKALNVPMAITDSTSLTQSGYVGEDVSSILYRLYQDSGEDIAACERGIVFIDEVDKIAKTGGRGRDVGGASVQQELLKLVEGSKVQVPIDRNKSNPNAGKTVEIDTTNILFICAGAYDGMDDVIKARLKDNDVIGYNFDDKKKTQKESVTNEDFIAYGMIPELMGRFPIHTELEMITKKEMVRILTEPSNNIISQFKTLFTMDDVDLGFSKKSIDQIADMALEQKAGARGLRTILESIMLDTMYNINEFKGKSLNVDYSRGKFKTKESE